MLNYCTNNKEKLAQSKVNINACVLSLHVSMKRAFRWNFFNEIFLLNRSHCWQMKWKLTFDNTISLIWPVLKVQWVTQRLLCCNHIYSFCLGMRSPKYLNQQKNKTIIYAREHKLNFMFNLFDPEKNLIGSL